MPKRNRSTVRLREPLVTMTDTLSRLANAAEQPLIPEFSAHPGHTLINNPNSLVNTQNIGTFKLLYAILLREKYVIANE